MSDKNYSLTGLHLPENKSDIKKVKSISFVINDIIFVFSAALLLVWATSVFFPKSITAKFIILDPLLALMLALAFISLRFSTKHHLSDNTSNTERIKMVLKIVIPISCASFVTLVGIVGLAHSVFDLTIISMIGKIPVLMSLSFVMIGLCSIFAHTKVAHRYHVTQLFLLIIVTLSLIPIMITFYQQLFPATSSQLSLIPIEAAFALIIYSLGVLLRWPNRGFLGNFNTNSISSMLSLRLLIISLVVTPILGFITVAVSRLEAYAMYEAVALIAILLMVVFAVLAWFNIRLLYRFELERYLMKEELRIHNIDLKLDNENLASKMSELEQSRQSYLDKLSNQTKYQSAIEARE